MTCDLLLQGGTLADPAQALHAVRDVAYSGGMVAAVGEDLPGSTARQVLDAHGVTRIGAQHLGPVVVVKGGKVYRQARG